MFYVKKHTFFVTRLNNVTKDCIKNYNLFILKYFYQYILDKICIVTKLILKHQNSLLTLLSLFCIFMLYCKAVKNIFYVTRFEVTIKIIVI